MPPYIWKSKVQDCHCCPRVCIEDTWQGGVNGEKNTWLPWREKQWVWTACIFRIVIWFFHGEKSKLTILSTFVFWQQSQQILKRKSRGFFLLKKIPFSMGSRSFYSLIPPATQWRMPHNSMPGEAGKGNDISSEPLKVDKEKGHSVLPPFSLSCHSDVLHP